MSDQLDRPLIRTQSHTQTRRQFIASLYHRCEQLKYEGVSSGAKILIQISNSSEYLASVFATLLNDAVACVVDPAIKGPLLQKIVEECRPSLTFSGHTLAEVNTPSSQDSWNLIRSNILSKTQDTLTNSGIVFFSSGSTGIPKAVLLKQQHLAHVTKVMKEFFITDKQHVELILSPLSHTDGWQRVAATLACGGQAVIYGDLLTFSNLAHTITALQVNALYLPPPLVWRVANSTNPALTDALKQLQELEVGSAKYSSSVLSQLMHRVPNARVIVHYGLTESSRATILDTRKFPDKLNTVGLPISGVEFSLKNGEQISKTGSGEILIRGQQTISHYLNKPANIYRDNWLLTGDLGKIDDDGFLTFLGRLDDMICSRGYHFHPVEAELIVQEAGITAECAMFSDTSSESSLSGDLIYLVLTSNAVTSHPDEKDTLRELRNILPGYMLPQKIFWLEELPKTNSGKIDRKRLRELLLNKDNYLAHFSHSEDR